MGVETQVGTLGQIALFVKDLEGAVKFYRDAVGLKFLFQVPRLAFFDCGGVRLMLDAAAEVERHGNSVLYFKVELIREARATLVSRGVAFVDEPHMIAKMPDHELWMTFFRDPERNLQALMSEVRA